MRLSKIKSLLTVILFSAVHQPADAQIEKVAMHFADLPSDPVKMSMGTVWTVDAFEEKTSAANIGYMVYSPSDYPTSYLTVQGTYAICERLSISLDAVYGKCPDYETINQNGSSTGEYSPAQMILSAGVEYRFSDFLNAGISMKYINESLAPQARYSAVASDIYAIGEFELSSNSSIIAGLKLANMGTKVRSMSGMKYALPSSIKTCAGYTSEFGSKVRMQVVSELDYYFHGATAAAAGASCIYNDRVAIRAGYRFGEKTVVPSYASAGLGIELFGAQLNFAYLFGSEVLANSMLVSLGYSF